MKSSLSIWRYVLNVKSTVKILSIFVAFLDNVNFMCKRKRVNATTLFEVFLSEVWVGVYI